VLRSSDWPLQWPLAGVLLAAALYHLGGRARETRTAARRSAAFYGGLLALAVAVDSPVDAYADSLFAAHMVQHVLLTLVAPPLLVLGRPWPRLARPLPLRLRRPATRAAFGVLPRGVVDRIAAPLPAFALFNGVLLSWHLPALYDLTLRSEPVHLCEHALFFATGLLFWRHLVPTSARPRLGDGGRAVYGTAALLVGWLLAVVLGLAPDPVYSAYASLPHRPGGISALADQQLAAGIMWVPASIPVTVATLVAAYRWLDPKRRRPRVAEDLRPRET